MPKSDIDSVSPMVQVMAWRRIGQESLPEPMDN